MFRRFLYGRYGTDQLNVALLVSGVVLSFLNIILLLIFRNSAVYGQILYPLFYALTLTLLGLSIARSLSRNTFKRQQENKRFLSLRARLLDRRNRYFRCPKCRQTVRVPRHRGKISIRCPKCGENFIRKT